MKKIPNKYAVFIAVLVTILVVSGVTYAAFSDKAKQTGASFSVGSSDIKLLKSITGGVDADNLADEISGPSFSNITPSWTSDYALKVYNNATTSIQLTSNANYLTANDPDDLRSILYVEPIGWNDTNSNGIGDAGETGVSYGRKTFVKWKTEGYDFGQVTPGSIKGLLLRFSTDAVSDTKQGKSAVFDFEFNSVGL